MKSSIFQQYVKEYLINNNENFNKYSVKGKLIFRSPIDMILCGFMCESSAFSKSDFMIEIFAQPLYIRFPTFSFTFGTRLKRQDGSNSPWWSISEKEGPSEVMLIIRNTITKSWSSVVAAILYPRLFNT